MAEARIRARCSSVNSARSVAVRQAVVASSYARARAARSSASAAPKRLRNSPFVANVSIAKAGTFAVAIAAMSSSAPCAIPIATAANCNVISDNSGTRITGASMAE